MVLFYNCTRVSITLCVMYCVINCEIILAMSLLYHILFLLLSILIVLHYIILIRKCCHAISATKYVIRSGKLQ